MKKFTKSILTIACLMLVAVSFCLVGCNGTTIENITLSKTTLSLKVGASETLTVTITPEEAKDTEVTWESSDTSVATVANGKVTAVKAGTADITAKAGDKTATCKVTVTAADDTPVTPTDTVKSISLNKTTLALTVNGTEKLVATVDPTTATVTWTSSATNIATVGTDGTVTAKAAGEATITAKAGDKTATCKVTVTAAEVAVTSVTVTPETAALKVGGNVTLTATVAPNNATNKTVAWTTSDDKVATVDNTGKVTAVKAGTATITATVGGKTDTCVVTVTDNFFSAPTTAVKLDNVDFTNGADVKIAYDKTENSVEVYKITGTATKFTEQTAQAFDKKADVSERDDYIVLKFNVDKTKDVEVGWVKTADEALVGETADNKTKTPGYKKFKDDEFILCVTGNGHTNLYKVVVDSKAYVLDLSGLKTQDFITVNNNTIYIGSETPQDTKKGFKNADTSLKITKEGNVYKLTGKATAFTEDNAKEFNPARVDKHHAYVVYSINVKAGESYKTGWVATPDEELKAPTNGGEADAEHEGASAGYKAHNQIGEGDDDIILWVTRPEAAGLNYFRYEIGNRVYVLDVSGLQAATPFFSNEDKEVDNKGQQVTTTGQGFKNASALTFTDTEGGNVTKVTGKSTKFTATNKDKFPNDGETGNTVTESDEYIVIRLALDDNETYKVGWVKNAGDAFETSYPAHSSVQSGGNKQDETLVVCVTKPGHAGYYLRVEINSDSNELTGNTNKTRAYVLDLSDLESSTGAKLFDFFRVDDKEEKISDKAFKNTDTKLAISRIDHNVWRITGKATNFTTENAKAFDGNVDNGPTKTTDSYILLTLNVKANTKATWGWVGHVGDTIDDSNGNKNNNGYHKDVALGANEPLVLLVSRDITAKIFWVQVDGVNYYLDCTNLTVPAKTTSGNK